MKWKGKTMATHITNPTLNWRRVNSVEFLKSARYLLGKPRAEHRDFDHADYDAVAIDAQRRVDEAAMVLEELNRLGIKPRRK